MAEIENHFTFFIRLPFKRGDFVDPPPVSWSAAKERALWEVVSRQGQGKGNEIDWHALAEQFQVTQPFILQQAAWLYERQLSQVRAQMRKVGNRQSNAPSPAPSSVASSMMGGQPMKRAGSGGSRVPSRLSTQHLGSPVIGGDSSTPPTPGKGRMSQPLRSGSGGPQAPSRPSPASSRPLSRQRSKEVEAAQYTHSRRGSTQDQLSRSPKVGQIEAYDSEEETAQSKISARRGYPPSLHRRSLPLRKDPSTAASKPPPTEAEADDGDNDNDNDDDDDPPNFLPFASDPAEGQQLPISHSSTQDPSATLRGTPNFGGPARPATQRQPTSEKIALPSKQSTQTRNPRPAQLQHISSSTSSLSSPMDPRQSTAPPSTRISRAPNPQNLSPQQQAALASASLSPRRRARGGGGAGNGGSESSPSMGSSFSDLDDASVTQSALEEALMSNMGNTTNTIAGGVASRVSGISQALGRRYFDARQQPPPPPSREI